MSTYTRTKVLAFLGLAASAACGTSAPSDDESVGTQASELFRFPPPRDAGSGAASSDGSSKDAQTADGPSGLAKDAEAADAAAVGSISEFPSSGANPLVLGSDGNLYFIAPGELTTDSGANQTNEGIGRITPSGAVATFADMAASPGGNGALMAAITEGPDGNIWFVDDIGINPTLPNVGRVTPAGVVTDFPVPLFDSLTDAHLDGITAGPDGNLWFTGSSESGEGRSSTPIPQHGFIGRITTSGTITLFASPNTNSTPGSIIAGSDGNVWFTDSGNIGRITPSGTITEFASPGTGALVLGPDGNIYFSFSGELTTEAGTSETNDSIGRITPSGTVTTFTDHAMSPGGNGALIASLTAGPDGNIWFVDDIGVNPTLANVGRLTPSGVITDFSVPIFNALVDEHLDRIITGPDGNLWFDGSSEAGEGRSSTPIPQNGFVGRITPGGSIALFATPTQNTTPQSMASGSDGNVWCAEGPGIGRVLTR
jgi:virginiamycin B lyase